MLFSLPKEIIQKILKLLNLYSSKLLEYRLVCREMMNNVNAICPNQIDYIKAIRNVNKLPYRFVVGVMNHCDKVKDNLEFSVYAFYNFSVRINGIKLTDSILELKWKIFGKIGLLPKEQNITFRGKILINNKLVKDYKPYPYCTLDVFYRHRHSAIN